MITMAQSAANWCSNMHTGVVPMIIMAQSTANWRNTHTHMVPAHSLTH